MRYRWIGQSGKEAVPDVSLSAAGTVSVLREKAGPDQGAVLGRRWLSAAVLASEERQFPMAQEHGGSAAQVKQGSVRLEPDGESLGRIGPPSERALGMQNS